jgi:hypothetical protein
VEKLLWLRTAGAAAVALVPSLASCLSAPDGGGVPRVEVLGAVRNPDDRAGRGDESHGVAGLTVLYEPSSPGFGGEIGLRGADFDDDSGTDSWFAEFHAGARWYPVAIPSPLRPWIGAGVMTAFGRHTDEWEDDDPDLHSDSRSSIALPAGLYGALGLDVAVERLVLGFALRAALADGIDPFARDPDDVAVDLVASIGWRL